MPDLSQPQFMSVYRAIFTLHWLSWRPRSTVISRTPQVPSAVHFGNLHIPQTACSIVVQGGARVPHISLAPLTLFSYTWSTCAVPSRDMRRNHQQTCTRGIEVRSVDPARWRQRFPFRLPDRLRANSYSRRDYGMLETMCAKSLPWIRHLPVNERPVSFDIYTGEFA